MSVPPSPLYIKYYIPGISFYNLCRHGALYSTVCSTAARSSTRLIYAGTWRSSLLVDVAKILAASMRKTQEWLPSGILYTCRSQFWLILPSEGCEEKENLYSESLVLGPVKMPADVGSPAASSTSRNAVDQLEIWCFAFFPGPCCILYGFSHLEDVIFQRDRRAAGYHEY